MPVGASRAPAAAPASDPATPPPPTPNRRTIRPTANPNTGLAPKPVVRHRSRRAVRCPRRGRRRRRRRRGRQGEVKETLKAALPGAALPPLKLTQITFNDEMHGRFGTGKETDKTETRWADFFGDVQALHAIAPDDEHEFDFDNPPPDGTFLTAQTVRVVSEPPPPGTQGPRAELPQGVGERQRRHDRHDDPGRQDHLRLAQGACSTPTARTAAT